MLKIGIVIIAVNIIVGVAVISFYCTTNPLIIEAGFMNFWSMVCAIGAFICSAIILLIHIGKAVKEWLE